MTSRNISTVGFVGFASLLQNLDCLQYGSKVEQQTNCVLFSILEIKT
jgi:hypothetical protein